MTVVSDVDVVRDAAISSFKKLAKGRTVDEFLCHPKDALELCKRVRDELGKRTPDQDICRTLLNARKAGVIK